MAEHFDLDRQRPQHGDAEAVRELRDLDDRIVISGGPVEFLGCTPYDGFTHWCKLNGIDWFVYGWDWRRRIEDVAAFFVTRFLPRFRELVLKAGLPDPLADFAVLGHSFGGMVLNLVNRRTDPILGGMQRAPRSTTTRGPSAGPRTQTESSPLSGAGIKR